MWLQRTITLAPKPRGFHLIDDELISSIPELKNINIGLMHLLIKHTSASLTLNENADPTVRHDLERHFNHTVVEAAAFYRHTDEGDDDMPAHIKSSIIGVSHTIPITNGALNLGVWQGIYLCEHRNYGGSRQVVITVNGE
ncbi:secondary thiamine-phosphate synthase enzyme YjbQ [Shewanella intestini]|uniref:YjbQ family protein n=1 Tax=Shewanella intestini TaxID=2017544 RepID=A0ABS5I2B1_9GAMM|nr:MULTISPECIES: secondary thiamine-phosphate synthase enzyme YjbQ [Shewanella]MBR9727490.1 YjbQ family protein [Shewanella intestini]MRG35460.1 YjbQ family protein [Shewanella sp. XMDDZSB0408]